MLAVGADGLFILFIYLFICFVLFCFFSRLSLLFSFSSSMGDGPI